MVFMMFLSHGTQDLYPDFLRTVHDIAPATVSYIAIFYNVGAVIGAIFFGAMSERIGRRYSMISALGLSLLAANVMNRVDGWLMGGGVAVAATAGFLSWDFLLTIATMMFLAASLGAAWTASRLTADGQLPDMP